ncbi:DUF560 domain-containing protein [Exilibacterium tricleocarpae]|uniref:DUF560 domain-containing protein n=1 Tax=Exilibacterium tricleocarpae TaxID=2591008 RepID=A0A545U9U2_9GAMM|nr:surface lipoprotein assembly modifier [Exilibacterium tricleocarpae]TQV86236.1 DUF560 domain-containing protein [Exilibacterium tricleocarpae]
MNVFRKHTEFLAICLAAAALAQPAFSDFSAEVSAGVEYDSNISVERLDINTTESDYAALVDLDLDYKLSLTKAVKVTTGYSFSQSLHQDLDDFDVQTHLFSAGLSSDFGRTTAGVNYYYADSSLGGDGFLTLQQASPYISHYFTKQVFLRSAFTYTDKDFDGRPARDADAAALGADLYYFIDGSKHYVSFGYKYEDEDANTDRFDHDSQQLRLRWVKRLDILGKESKLKLGWRYEQRDYDAIDSAGTRRRDDDRHRWEAELELPLSKQSYLALEYQYSDYESTLAAADYTQHMARVRAGYKF